MAKSIKELREYSAGIVSRWEGESLDNGKPTEAEVDGLLDQLVSAMHHPIRSREDSRWVCESILRWRSFLYSEYKVLKHIELPQTTMKEETYYKTYPTAEKDEHIGDDSQGIKGLRTLSDRLKEEKVLEWKGDVQPTELTEHAIEDEIMGAYHSYAKYPDKWEKWGGPDFLVESLARKLQTYLNALGEHPTGHSIVLHNINVDLLQIDRADAELSSIGYSRVIVDSSYEDRIQNRKMCAGCFLHSKLPYAELKELLVPQKD